MYLPLGISNTEIKMSLKQIPLGFYNVDHMFLLHCTFICTKAISKTLHLIQSISFAILSDHYFWSSSSETLFCYSHPQVCCSLPHCDSWPSSNDSFPMKASMETPSYLSMHLIPLFHSRFFLFIEHKKWQHILLTKVQIMVFCICFSCLQQKISKYF